MTEINYVEVNLLCSLFYLNLPLEIVQRLYSEYIIDYKQKIKIIYITYNKYKYLFNYKYLNCYKTYEYVKYEKQNSVFRRLYIDLNWNKNQYNYIDKNYIYEINCALSRIKYKNEKKLLKYKKKQEKRNNKYSKRNTYYQNKERLKLKNNSNNF